MASSKTLFDAVDAELKNARIAILNADRYLDAIKEAVEKVEIVRIPTKKLEKDMEDYLNPST